METISETELGGATPGSAMEFMESTLGGAFETPLGFDV